MAAIPRRRAGAGTHAFRTRAGLGLRRSIWLGMCIGTMAIHQVEGRMKAGPSSPPGARIRRGVPMRGALRLKVAAFPRDRTPAELEAAATVEGGAAARSASPTAASTTGTGVSVTTTIGQVARTGAGRGGQRRRPSKPRTPSPSRTERAPAMSSQTRATGRDRLRIAIREERPPVRANSAACAVGSCGLVPAREPDKLVLLRRQRAGTCCWCATTISPA